MSSAVDVVDMWAAFSSGFSAAAAPSAPASEAVESRGDDTDEDDDKTCKTSLPPLLLFRPRPTPLARLPLTSPLPLMGPLPLTELLLLDRASLILSLALRLAPGAKDELLAAGLRPVKIPPPAAASNMLMESSRPCPSRPRWLLLPMRLPVVVLVVVVAVAAVAVVVFLSPRTERFNSASVFLNDGRAAGSWAQHALTRAARSPGASPGTGGRSPALTASTSLSTPATPFHGTLRARISHNTMPKLYTSLLKLETFLFKICGKEKEKRVGSGPRPTTNSTRNANEQQARSNRRLGRASLQSPTHHLCGTVEQQATQITFFCCCNSAFFCCYSSLERPVKGRTMPH